MKPRENLFMPRHQLGRLSLAVLAVLLLSVPALAAKAPPPPPAPATPPPATKWAILPLVVVGGEGKEAKQYQAAFESEVTKSGIDRANPKLVTGFLAQEANCIRKDECLGRLAKAVNAERTLLVTISPFAKEIVLTAKMIGLTGNVLNETASTVNRGPNETALAASRDSFEVLLSDLQTELAPLSPPPTQTPKPSPPVADAPKAESPPTATAPQTPPATPPTTPTSPSSPSATPPISPAPVAATQPPAEAPASPTTWKTPVGIGSAAAGVVGLGVGTVFMLQSGQTWAKMKPFYEGGRLPTQDQIPALLDIKRTAESQGTISTIAFAAGAVALGAGTFLWLTDSPAASPEPAKVSVQVAFTPASGMVIIHFP